MTFDAGTIRSRMTLDRSGFTKGLLEAQGLTAALGPSISSFLANPLVGVANFARQALGAVKDLFFETARLADQYAKTAKATGASVEFLSALAHAAKLSGTDVNAAERSLARLMRTARDAAEGVAEPRRAFEQLGLSVYDAGGGLKDAEALLLDVAEGLSRVEGDTRRAALAQVIMGRGATSMLPLLREGRDGIRGMLDEAERLGIVMTEDLTGGAEAFNDELTRLKAQLTGEFQRAALDFMRELLPLLEDLNAALLFMREHRWILTAIGDLTKSVPTLGVLPAVQNVEALAEGGVEGVRRRWTGEPEPGPAGERPRAGEEAAPAAPDRTAAALERLERNLTPAAIGREVARAVGPAGGDAAGRAQALREFETSLVLR